MQETPWLKAMHIDSLFRGEGGALSPEAVKRMTTCVYTHPTHTRTPTYTAHHTINTYHNALEGLIWERTCAKHLPSSPACIHSPFSKLVCITRHDGLWPKAQTMVWFLMRNSSRRVHTCVCVCVVPVCSYACSCVCHKARYIPTVA